MSGFDIKKLAAFFPTKSAGSTGLAFCKQVASTDTMKHIRRLSPAGLLTKGGADTKSLCESDVERDTSVIASLFNLEKVQSLSTPIDRLCQQCLHSARLVLEPVKA